MPNGIGYEFLSVDVETNLSTTAGGDGLDGGVGSRWARLRVHEPDVIPAFMLSFPDFDLDRDEIVIDVNQLFTGEQLRDGVTCTGTEPACAPIFRQLGLPFEGPYPSGHPAFRKR